MQQMTLQDLRASQLEMLKQFDKVCRENNIRYTLAGGTLLGAIRHNGYIPWDDDIDVMVPYPDYKKIVELRRNFENERFTLKIPYDKFNTLPFSYIKFCDLSTRLIEFPNTKKIEYNVYIDIFPCFGLPTDIKINSYLFRKCAFLCKIYDCLKISLYNKNYGVFLRKILWNFIYAISKIVSPIYILRKLEGNADFCNFDKADFIGNATCGYGVKERFHRTSFELTEHDFEGRKYMILCGYDEYLTNLYGDYMKLPPKEQQVLRHNFLAYWL